MKRPAARHSYRIECFVVSLLLVSIQATNTIAQQRKPTLIAVTPPMGWNSWDSYGTTLNEETIKANANWIAKNLKRFGWEYVVVDEGWYLANLNANDDSHVRFEMDGYGRYVPVPARFPSAGKDFT